MLEFLNKSQEQYDKKSVEKTTNKKCNFCGSQNIILQDKSLICADCGGLYQELEENNETSKKTGILNKVNEKLEERRIIIKEKHAAELQQKEDLNTYIKSVSVGKALPNNISSTNSPIMLKPKEELILIFNGVNLAESRAVRLTQSRGRSGGVSVRVAKGVSVRSGSGGSKSVSISHDEMTRIDTGTLILTNKRLVFMGDKKSVNIDLRKIIVVKPFNNAIDVQIEGKSKVQRFLKVHKTKISFNIKDNHYNNISVHGGILKAMITGCVFNINNS
jgi:hypothetical protein